MTRMKSWSYREYRNASAMYVFGKCTTRVGPTQCGSSIYSTVLITISSSVMLFVTVVLY
jgi:hypothetical protein